MNNISIHKNFLLLALQQAEIRRGFCAPNPSVGAVVVKDNKILATGYHFAAGHPHAEVDALNKIADEAIGATIYVTLEPCCHFGKTPPCTDLLIKRGIKEVIYGQKDPNPQVAEQSQQQLELAGIKTTHLPLKEITEFYQSYIYAWLNKKPWATAKIALSLDGKIAGKNGERVNITGETAQQFTHQQRKRVDAILTTAKTILADDPLLNVRLNNEIHSKPIYILDSQLRCPTDAKIFSHHPQITLLHTENASAEKISYFTEKNIRTCVIPKNDLNAVLNLMYHDDIKDLWIEAGGSCFQAFARQNLLNRAYIYVAAKWLGDEAFNAFNNDFNPQQNAKSVSWQSLGEDGLCQIEYE